MSLLPADEAILRFKQNEERYDGFINGLGYSDSTGRNIPGMSEIVYKISNFNNRLAWATATLYLVKDLVLNAGVYYVAVNEHTSGATFAGDEAANWRVYQGVIAGDLEANDQSKASSMIVQPTEYTDEQPTTIFSIMRARANVKRFWVSGDGNNWTNAFDKMLASGARNLIIPGDVAYESNGGHLIGNDQDLYFDSAEILLKDDTKRLFSSIQKSRWSIRGMVRVEGSLTVAAYAVETGLYIEDGKRYLVENFLGTNFKGSVIHLSGSVAGALRGDRGKFVGPSAFESTCGFKIDAGAGAEYNDWIAAHASGCLTGAKVAAGNNFFNGGVIVDNARGVWLTNGTNHAHGGFIGTQINHNTNENIYAVDVVNGHKFVGCNIYGNGASTGKVWLIGCKGINIVDGTLDAYVYNDLGAGSGANVVSRNYFPGDYGVSLLSADGAAGLAELFVSGNYSPTGPAEQNDVNAVFVHVSRATSTLSLAGSDIAVVFNNKIKDNRNCYDETTGIFTAPVTGTYEFNVAMTVTGTSLATSYSEFKYQTSSTVGYIVLALNSTLIEGGRTLKYPMTSGQTMQVKSTITGTSPVLAVTTSQMTISLCQ